MTVCILCNDKDLKLFLTTHKGNYLLCSQCGLVRFDRTYDISEIRKIYNDAYFTKKTGDGTGADFVGEEKLYLARFQNRIQRIENRIQKGNILDIGASVGQFLFVARASGWDVSGIELSEGAAGTAAKKYGIKMHVGAIETANFCDNFFDVVTLWHVFEHFSEPLQSLGKIHNLLKRDGLLVMELPNIGSNEALKNKEGWSYLRPGEHLFHYTPDSITHVMEKVGFKIEAVEYESGGTGIGEKMDKIGFGALKTLAIKLFPFVKWIRTLLLRFSARDSKEIMIVYSRKCDFKIQGAATK